MNPIDLPAGPILADTNVFSIVWRGKPTAKDWTPFYVGRLATVSFVTVGEVLKGAIKSGWSQASLDDFERQLRTYEVIPGTIAVARAYARIKAALEPRGLSVEDNDVWIAASALSQPVPLPILTTDSDMDRIAKVVPELTIVHA